MSADIPKQGVLFEPPPFSPTYPSRASLSGVTLALLLTGRSLTHPEFEAITRSWRLGAYIEELRNDHNWPVDTIEIEAPTAHRPDRIIAMYVMPQWVLQEVGAAHG